MNQTAMGPSRGRHHLFSISVIRTFTALVLACLGPALFADGPVLLRKNQSVYTVGPHCEYFIDHGRKLGIEQISDRTSGPAFAPNLSENLNFGYTQAAIWVRFQVDDIEPSGQWFLQVDYLDDVRVWYLDENGIGKELRLGRKFPSQDTLRRYNFYYLKLPPRNGKTIVYLRATNEDMIGLHLAVVSMQAMLNMATEEIIYGIYFGLIGVMVLYNLFIFLILRDSSYVYYVVYIINILIVTLLYQGVLLNLFPPGSFFTPYMLETVILSLSLAFYIQFVRKFLLARETLPWLDKIMFVLMITALAHILTVFFVPYEIRTFTLAVAATATVVLTVILVVACLRRRYSPVNFFIFAFAAMAGGVTAFLLRAFGVLPNILVLDFSLQIGSGLEAVLLALGLAYRIYILRKEKAFAVQWGQSNLEKAERMESDYRMLFETAPLGIALFTLDGKYLAVNRSYCRMYERDSGELLGKYFFTLVYPESRHNAERQYWDTLVAGPRAGIATFERTNITRTGRRIIVRYFLNFTATPAGEPEGVLCCVEDISDLRTALNGLRTSVREKELLLKEVHHRVKNNLQIIISLFRLKSREIDDPICQEVLEATAGRIRAIANVHNRIYLSKDVSQVDSETFIPASVKQALSVTHLAEGQLSIAYYVDQAKFSVDIALPLSLIINELITNSVVHGFDGHEPLTIEVRFRSLTDGGGAAGLLLEIEDSGKGFPEDFPNEHFESFGLNLVETLTMQLGGTMTLVNRPHACVSIAFNGRDQPA